MKLGQARPFQFAVPVPLLDQNGVQKVNKKTGKPLTEDRVVWSQVLEPGTAVIVGIDANSKVKHGVPAIDDKDCGVSGSIVGRSIAWTMPWSVVDKRTSALKAKRERKRLIREEQVEKKQKLG